QDVTRSGPGTVRTQRRNRGANLARSQFQHRLEDHGPTLSLDRDTQYQRDCRSGIHRPAINSMEALHLLTTGTDDGA
ncbi:MAG: hypothetical protein KDA85_22560, partial [Planctomycetaceae bacterium]|nr:hypothetical protein [Planctomycetaceae bacterium]